MNAVKRILGIVWLLTGPALLLYLVNEAIKNNYDPYYIKHVMNCELMLWIDNIRKYKRSSISYEELKKLVDEYDQRSPLI
jgi:hypothetical protein